MNEHEIETLLAGLQPSGPSSTLSLRVEEELAHDREWMLASPKKRKQSWLSPMLWTSVGAAAAVLVMGIMPDTNVAPSSMSVAAVSPPSVMPVTTIREVVGAQNEGIQYNEESQLPEQHVKLVSMDHHAWIDPRDGAQITLEVPREDSVILPVSFQ
ncbi:MAG: hypothetical protein OJI67_05475 [Prosthecobacter sp.]|nr:hypothetical protein [Prosthecobacter sp.]